MMDDMNLTLKTMKFEDDPEMGPANERAALAGAFIRLHLPEVFLARQVRKDTIQFRGLPQHVALAQACVSVCGSTMNHANPLTAQ